MSRQVKASHQWWVCNKLHHPAISPEQGASKIVKISQQRAKLCRKLKWLVFFWDTVYNQFTMMFKVTLTWHLNFINLTFQMVVALHYLYYQAPWEVLTGQNSSFLHWSLKLTCSFTFYCFLVLFFITFCLHCWVVSTAFCGLMSIVGAINYQFYFYLYYFVIVMLLLKFDMKHIL